MTISKSLPPRPSLEALRKQAKKLGRAVAAGDAAAIARARAQLPDNDVPLTLRTAQLVIAREYGYAGWRELTAEVSRRLGSGLESAVNQARRIIHDNDVERLRTLLAEYPALLTWHGNDCDSEGGLLGFATGAYGDAGDAQREEWFTRAACAELLIDAGAVVSQSVCEGLLRSRAKRLLELFHRKGLLPRTLKFLAALGDIDGVRRALGEQGLDLQTINEAFHCACNFHQETAAALLLDRSVALDPELGRHIDSSVDRATFFTSFIEKRGPSHAQSGGLWTAFVMDQVSRAAHDGKVTAFVGWLARERTLLDDECVTFQDELICGAVLNDREAIIAALFGLAPAILRRQPPPRSQAIEFAFTYDKAHLVPLLTRIWPIPDDLPHAAALGHFPRVKEWFDQSGAPALGDLEQHYPHTSPHRQEHDDLDWGVPSVQHVLDTALAFAVINRHFDVADFLVEHGANVNTDWNSHEPASILHHLVFLPNPYASMQYLIDRGIDMMIKDYRWDSTAVGWARYGKSDEEMAQWLETAQVQREHKPR
jgi:hypothetical protein